MIQAKPIDLSEWVLNGGGAQGDSYDHISDRGIILKLFSDRIDEQTVRREVEIAMAVKRCGVPSPEPGEFVRVGNRYGIIFQRIPNKKSFCRAISDDPTCLKDMAVRFAKMGKKLHSQVCTDSEITSITDYYRTLLKENTTIDAHMREVMERCLDDICKQDSRTLLHGDYHFGNVITDGVNDYYIDLGSFAYGHPDFDNSMMYLNCYISNDEMIHHYYHISEAQAREFWKEYVREYYGPDAPSPEEFMRIYAPFLLLRSLFIEVILGNIPPVVNLRKVSMEALGE